MGQETFYELTKRYVPIIKNEAAYLSWRNSVLTVRTNKRVNFFEFSYNLECLERNIDFKESSVSSPIDSPATEMCNNSKKFMKSGMRNVDYTEMIVNSSYWPHNPSLTQEMTSVTMTKWSPQNFVKNESVFAILNNIGGVEIFAQQKIQWKSVLSLSPHIKEVLHFKNKPKSFKELKKNVHIVETSAICWAQELNPDNSCYFVTAQKNGTVLFWQISNDMNTVNIKGHIVTDMAEITRMKWIAKSRNTFWLICTNVLGQIYAYDLHEEEDIITLQQTYALWPHNDRMMTAGLNYTVIDNHLILICSKHRHLLVQVLDENGKVISQFLNNINDHRITDITFTKEGIYVATVNVKIYKINITYLNGNLSVDLVQLELKDPYTTYELYSLRFSRNNLICALAMVDRRVLCRKEPQKMEIVFLSTDSRLESILPTLLDNPTRKLTYHWDCIELLRFKITKLKINPNIDLNELYAAASHDAYKLKIYFILMIYITNLKKVLRIYSGPNVPETSAETVKEKILCLHAQSLLNNLYNKCQKDGKLDDIEMESLYGSKKYLEFYSRKYKTEIDFDKNVLNALENSCEYVCQSCDDNIEGFTCRHGHLNMFCMQTFSPIMTDDYLLCRSCGSTARSDLDFDPICVFCDLHLVRPD